MVHRLADRQVREELLVLPPTAAVKTTPPFPPSKVGSCPRGRRRLASWVQTCGMYATSGRETSLSILVSFTKICPETCMPSTPCRTQPQQSGLCTMACTRGLAAESTANKSCRRGWYVAQSAGDVLQKRRFARTGSSANCEDLPSSGIACSRSRDQRRNGRGLQVQALQQRLLAASGEGWTPETLCTHKIDGSRLVCADTEISRQETTKFLACACSAPCYTPQMC